MNTFAKHKSKILAISALLSIPLCANSQLTVVYLHPTGANYSQAFGVHASQQVGNAPGGGIWTGTAGSWTSLLPASATSCLIYGIRSNQQVGDASIGGVNRAGLWNGTAASFVDLHPATATLSTAFATNGAQQVGYAYFSGVSKAGLWNGTSASWVDLSPAGAVSSEARGISATQQVGNAQVGGVIRASVWTGSAASWVDLHPAGATASRLNAVSNGIQVGDARIGGAYHAGMWSGTPGSFVDLHPAGAAESSVYAVDGNTQVGYANISHVRAALWNGTANSFVDLHALLPQGAFFSSEARGVWRDGNTVYVVGSGYSTSAFAFQALLWVGTLDNFALVLNKTTVAGQNSVLGTIALADIKPTNTVFTTYDNSGLVTTPATVTVLAGQQTRNFQITTTAITSTVVTTIFAKRGSLTRSQSLTLTPLVPTALSFAPSQVTGGNSTTCRVVLNGVAGPGGRVVSIFDNSPFTTCPSTVTVPAGATDVFFTITTVPVTSIKTVTLTARVSAGDKTGTFRINP